MLTLPAIFLVLITSILIASMFEIKSKIAYFLAIYLFSISNVILTCTVTGFFHQLDNQYFFALIHGLIFVITLYYWKRKSKSIVQTPKQMFYSAKQFFNRTFRSHEILIFFVIVCLSVVFQLVLIYVMPPNTHDSMTTHMSRIGYWLQNGTYLPFNIHNIRDIYYPVNPAFQVLWTVVFTGNDTFVEASQFTAMLICSISVYGISRLLNRSPKSAIFNALLFLSYPIVIMQGTTSQTDLVVAALISCAFYFLILGFKQGQNKFLSISGLGIALALGSKQTAFFILPGYLFLFFFLWLKKRKEMPKAIQHFLIFTLIFFLIFGSLTYIINLVHFNGFFGPPGSVKSESTFSNIQDILKILKLNSLRLTYNAIDPSGLTYPLKNYFIKAKSILFSKTLDALNIELEGNALTLNEHQFQYLTVPHLTEDEAWYGPLGFFLMALALIAGFIRGIQKKDIVRLGLVFTFLVYVFCIVLFRPGWDPYQGRYFLSVAVLVTPLINIYFSENRFIHITRFGIITVAISIIITTHLLNEAKPVAVFENNPSLIRETIWNMDRTDKMTVQNKGLRDPFRSIASCISADAVVGLCIDTGVWDYPFFGSDFSQKIVPIYPRNLLVNKNWLQENEIDFVIMNTDEELFQDIPNFLTVIYEYENWKLLEVHY
jgi:4-amino-4-deoxy-L-arabinose transferase-like glycosyltransferase